MLSSRNCQLVVIDTLNQCNGASDLSNEKRFVRSGSAGPSFRRSLISQHLLIQYNIWGQKQLLAHRRHRMLLIFALKRWDQPRGDSVLST